MVQIDHRRRRRHFYFMWPNPDQITLTSSLNPSTSGTSVTFTAKVPTGWTGTISFFDGATQIGANQTLAGSPPQASVATSALSTGPHSITARYNGDATHPIATSAVLAQTVNKLSTTTAMSASPNPSTTGATVTLTATVTPSAATGNVTFVDQTTSTTLGTSGALSAGNATLNLPSGFAASGAHTLVGTYNGDATYNVSTSPGYTQTVNPGAAATTFDPSTLGAGVTLSGGNLTATMTTGASGAAYSVATHGTGKAYFEMLMSTMSTNATWVGIEAGTGSSSGGGGAYPVNWAYWTPAGINVGGVAGSTFPGIAFAAGDYATMAIDFTAKKMWVSRVRSGTRSNWNDDVIANQNPATGAGGVDISGVIGALTAFNVFVNFQANNDVATANFGGSAYAATAPAGFGNW